MVRLRMLNLYPDFDDATIPEPDPLPMPRWRDLPLRTLLTDLSFAIRYLIEALLSHGNISIPEILELLSVLSHVPADRRPLVLEGLFKWTRQTNITADVRGVSIGLTATTPLILAVEVARRISRPRPLDTHLVMTRRCLITPTKCILMPPVQETSNSMLRRWAAYEDRFLRVQFVDEDGDFPVKGETLIIDDKLQGTEGVFARLRRALKFGLFIAGRYYVFATFSESQVRSVGFSAISCIVEKY